MRLGGRVRWLYAALAAVLLAGAASAGAPEKRELKFTLDWVYTGAHAPFVLAAEGGYFRRHGLEVTLDRGWGAAETVRRVAAGDYDVGIADLGSIIQHNALDPKNPCTAVYVVQEVSPLAVISLEERNIRRPQDLRGKLLGAPEGEAARTLFPLFAAATQLDPRSVRWRAMDPALRETALIAGDVDAITGFTYTAQFLELQGVRRERIRMMRYADHGVSLYGVAVFARAEFLRRYPATMAAFVRGLNEALVASVANPALAIEALKRRQGDKLRAEVELERLRLAIDEAIATPQARRVGLSQVEPQRLQRQIDSVATALALPRRPPAASVYTEAFLPPREEKLLPRAGLAGATRVAFNCPRGARLSTGLPACP